MKTIKITILAIFLPFILNAQSKSDLIGNWELTKIEKNGEVKQFGMPFTFEKDNDIIIKNDFMGTWKLNEKAKTLEYKSVLMPKMSGKYSIVKFDKNSLILEKNKMKYYYIKKQ